MNTNDVNEPIPQRQEEDQEALNKEDAIKSSLMGKQMGLIAEDKEAVVLAIDKIPVDPASTTKRKRERPRKKWTEEDI